MSFTKETFMEYLEDIYNWRTDRVAFKTAKFGKRRNIQIKSTMQHIIYELRKIKNGFIDLKNDLVFAVGY